LNGPCLKICGVTNGEDAWLISTCGADYCGIVVNVGSSPRSLSLAQAKQVASASGVPVVILLCNPDVAEAQEVVREVRPHALQLLCQESPDFVGELKSRLPCRIWKTVHLPPVPGEARPQEYVEAGADALLVDSADLGGGQPRYGGTGKLVDWTAAAQLVQAVPIPVFLAGGLNPQNVEQALATVRPHGLDLCSGAEACVGRKDPQKVRLLVRNFRAAVAKNRKGPT
jgi:phosphoribosylanthranilate isomerase